MPRFPAHRGSTPFLLAASVAFTFAACGGSSVKHVAGDDTSGQGGSVGSGGSKAGTGGTGGSSGGTGGSVHVTGGTGALPATGGGAATSSDCDDYRQLASEELANIQRCTFDDECGQVLEDTSCGCTRNLVARFDANASYFRSLSTQVVNGEHCVQFPSDCDCPKADGFACVDGLCSWNYVKDPVTCSPATLGAMCVTGIPTDSGDVLVAGIPLALSFRPFGCYSSSCTKVFSSSCAVKPEGDDFYAVADMCLVQESDPNVACTDDCGGGSFECSTDYELTEGTHTVHFEGEFNLDVTFTVPSVVSDGSLCSVMDL